MPAELDPDDDNFIVVGDGGKDPSAEEYVFLPKGSRAIIAPKMSKNEKPTMSNAVAAIANTALKGRADRLKKAAGGLTYGKPSSDLAVPAQHQAILDRIANGQTVALGSGMASTLTSKPLTSRPRTSQPATQTSSPSTTVMPSPALSKFKRANTAIDQIGGDSPWMTRINDLMQAFLRRPGWGFAKDGATVMGKLDEKAGKKKLIKAADGLTYFQPFGGLGQTIDGRPLTGGAPAPRPAVINPNVIRPEILTPMSSRTSNPNMSPVTDTKMTEYQKAQLELQRQQLANQLQIAQLSDPNARYNADMQLAGQKYSSDAQRQIAEMNIAAQRQQAEMMNRFNMQRLALDKLLGTQQIEIDKKRAAEEAMQLLMTRAGRQMVAPGGNVIPQMQPTLGKTIN